MNVNDAQRIKGGIFLFKKLFIGFFLILSFFSITTEKVQAVGVAPGTITVNNVANGVTIPKKVRITRPTTAGTLTFRAEAQGEASRYISLSNQTVTILPGQSYADFEFSINPKTASNGSHKAFLVFTTTEGKRGGSQFGVTTYEGATAEINFNVTDSQVNLISIGGLVTEPVESIISPTFTFNIMNEGNVDSRPDEIKVTITDRNHTILLQETILKDLLPLVAPGQTQSVTVSTTKKLPPGVYYLNAAFLHNGKKIFEKNDAYFTVSPEGTLSQDGELKSISVLPSEGTVGTLLKIDGVFANTGSIGTQPKFFVQVSREGKPLDTLQSSQEYVGVKREGKFSVTFRPDTTGVYEFTGYFAFGIKETARKKTTATITSLVSNLRITAWLKGCTSNSIIVSLAMFAACMTALFAHYFRLWQKHKRCICPYGCDCHNNTKHSSGLMTNSMKDTEKSDQTPMNAQPKTEDPVHNFREEQDVDDQLYS